MMHDPIVKTIDVPCPAARAFEVFVHKISRWWPMDHSASAAAGAKALAVTIEPHVGGAVFETMHDGGRNDWGKVLEYVDGEKLAMTWHPGNNADNQTRVDVTFEALPGEKTRVTLTHSGWEVWGDAASEKRGTYDGGWDFVLGQCFANTLVDA